MIFLHLTKLIGKKNVGGFFLLEVCKFSYETANVIQQKLENFSKYGEF